MNEYEEDESTGLCHVKERSNVWLSGLMKMIRVWKLNSGEIERLMRAQVETKMDLKSSAMKAGNCEQKTQSEQ